ncbi:iron hydrogenase small subunit [Clostridium sp. 'deep sea']|uniref:NADH-dependent [FeFe] hydrogenase, group A6 n=1 Tax=Clostridium sp. 'deep sea' TaxID=2779445 RepID=UPI001896A2D5|nr:NADH-dependent [FeFe] hydrogenase, group A6 [Clostridium sp. 'deep sea']QOR36363.1 iron hydrogenase small subunit [Clostridium sp. 'deep sea']
MQNVTLTIDGRQVTVPAGTTVLEAAKQLGIDIPTLCYLPKINEIGACRVCVVEIEGARNLEPSCIYKVREGMVVKTNSPRARAARKINTELILSDHAHDCLVCDRNNNCELQSLAARLGIREYRFEGAKNNIPIDNSSESIFRDPSKCINCRRCIAVCAQIQGVHALGAADRGFESAIVPAQHKPLADISCVNCGQCTLVCPTGALTEVNHVTRVSRALANPNKHVVVQTAPATRVALGEEFGFEPGANVKGRMVAALRQLGFDAVFDTDFTADLTIMEEGTELIDRLTNGGVLPMITSCSPGWIKFIEHNFPTMLPNLSTCKSPQQMFGALAKTYYPESQGIDPKEIYSVSIMPCTAKKFEITRPGMDSSGYQDVDAVLTTRELAKLIKSAGIDLATLADEEYDAPLGISTGAGLIFGATGGVMEAALRTAYEIITGETLAKLDFEMLRGVEGVKRASIQIGDLTVNVAVAHSLAKARELMEKIQSGEIDDLHFIEIMACPGGCIGGGGQPRSKDPDVIEKRIAGIYTGDKEMKLRKSHENPAVQELYEKWLGKPNGHKSHELLHTHYVERER